MRVAIIGAGPAGATLATLLASEGTDVTLFDDGRRPELLVGESLIPALVPILQRLGVEPDVTVRLDDSWSTDDITAEGREKLRAAGFAPPAPRPAGRMELVQLQRGFRCPYCGSTSTKLENLFGPTPCRSIRYCDDCRQPFEQFKTI